MSFNVFFDENTSIYIAKALNVLESNSKEIIIKHTTDVERLGKGAADLAIAQFVNHSKGILFTQDDDFKKSQMLVQAMKEYPIGLFYFKQPKKTTYWELVKTYTTCWLYAREEIKTMNIPFYFEIMKSGKIKKRNHLSH